jgi:hypothetical protein
MDILNIVKTIESIKNGYKRNLQRWVDVKSHDQKIDGKYDARYRLVQMAREIAEGVL